VTVAAPAGAADRIARLYGWRVERVLTTMRATFVLAGSIVGAGSTLLLILLCACSFVALLPAFSDGIKLVRRATKDAAARRQRKKRMSSGY
jgi:UPF0716 family protein affecting phage T7 exclusion